MTFKSKRWRRFKLQWELEGVERDLLAATQRDLSGVLLREQQSYGRYIDMLRDRRSVILDELRANT